MSAPRQGAKPEPLGLMACKAILWSNLPSSAKTIGAILVEHVNWKAGQDYRCDPGVDRLVVLSGHSRSTVQAALRQLEAACLIVVHTHGGRLMKNAYEFRWDVIRGLDSQRREALKSGRRPPWIDVATRPEMETQTRVHNPYEENPLSEPESAGRHTRRSFSTVARRDAARQKAGKRWEDDLRDRFPEQYVALIPLIDETLKEAATDAEMSRRGTGVDVALKALLARAARGGGRDG